MQVDKYVFQSPSTSQVQVRRLDPASKEEDTSTSQSEQSSASFSTSSNQTQPVHPTEVESSNTTQRLLDIYA